MHNGGWHFFFCKKKSGLTGVPAKPRRATSSFLSIGLLMMHEVHRVYDIHFPDVTKKHICAAVLQCFIVLACPFICAVASVFIVVRVVRSYRLTTDALKHVEQQHNEAQ